MRDLEKDSARPVSGIKKVSNTDRSARLERIRSSDYSDLTPANCLHSREEMVREVISSLNEKNSDLNQQFKEGKISREDIGRIFHETVMETMIAVAGNKINEGNDAVILELDYQTAKSLLGEVQKELPDYVLSEEDTIAKLLKIFRFGDAREEARKQEKARKVLAASPVSQRVAIPEVLAVAEAPLDEKQALLMSCNAGIQVGEKLGFIIMEEVQGVDLITKIYRQLAIDYLHEDNEEGYADTERGAINFALIYKLKKQLNLFKVKDNDSRARIQTLATRLANVLERIDLVAAVKQLGLSKDNIKVLSEVCDLAQEIETAKKISKNPQEKTELIEEYLGSVRNYNLLDHLLVDHFRPEFQGRPKEFSAELNKRVAQGGLVEERVVDDVREAIKTLHQKGIYHCDLHQRNIMFGKGRDGEEKVYLIDFAKTNDHGTTDSNNDSNYQHSGEKWLSDDEICSPGGLLFLACQNPEKKK